MNAASEGMAGSGGTPAPGSDGVPESGSARIPESDDEPEGDGDGLVSPISDLGLTDEINIHLATAPGPPRTVRDVLALARDGRLGDIKGIGPARKRTIEVSLRLAGCDLGAPSGPRFFLPGRHG